MNAITFDTLASARRLKAQGLVQEQAEAIAEEMRAAHEASREEMVTVHLLDARIAELKADLIKWMFGGFLALAGLSVTILLKLH